mmetsp:Transcript_6447/g.24168  ORF Transcript_6447/g.24168 Transcript_6447/m.24168 type:complete len:202 (-) Transcript_6447:7-612(-)
MEQLTWHQSQILTYPSQSTILLKKPVSFNLQTIQFIISRHDRTLLRVCCEEQQSDNDGVGGSLPKGILSVPVALSASNHTQQLSESDALKRITSLFKTSSHGAQVYQAHEGDVEVERKLEMSCREIVQVDEDHLAENANFPNGKLARGTGSASTETNNGASTSSSSSSSSDNDIINSDIALLSHARTYCFLGNTNLSQFMA